MEIKDRGFSLYSSQGKRSGDTAVVAARGERQGEGPHVLLPFLPKRSLGELCSKLTKRCGGDGGGHVVSLTGVRGLSCPPFLLLRPPKSTEAPAL